MIGVFIYLILYGMHDTQWNWKDTFFPREDTASHGGNRREGTGY